MEVKVVVAVLSILQVMPFSFFVWHAEERPVMSGF